MDFLIKGIKFLLHISGKYLVMAIQNLAYLLSWPCGGGHEVKIEKRQIHNTLLESFESQIDKDWRLVSKKMGDVEFLRHSLFPIKVYFFIDSMCWQTPTSPPASSMGWVGICMNTSRDESL